MRYKILAQCNVHEDWEVDDNGKPSRKDREIAGVELDGSACYKVRDDFGEYIGEGLTFEQACEIVDDLSDPNAIS